MKKVCASLLMISILFIVNAQDENTFFFRDQIRDTANLKLDYSLMKSHFLGEAIARKMYRLEKTYTHIEAPTAMSPTAKTIVRKPGIYYPVLKLNKYYRKEIKKAQITQADAISKYGRILDIAYMIYAQDTSEFEEFLKQNKKPDGIEAAFEKIKIY